MSIQLKVGTRVTVYSPDDDQWYKGTVVVCDPDNNNCFIVDYDNGDYDWIDITTTTYRASSKPETFIKKNPLRLHVNQQRIQKLVVGSRISVWWPKEKEFYTGTLSEILTNEFDNLDASLVKPHQVRYDCGTEEWTNLVHRIFKRVQNKAERLEVGSRVSVYHKDRNRFYRGTVIAIKPKRGGKPHQVQYDQDVENQKNQSSKTEEWINLYAHPFLDIEPPQSVADPSVHVDANTIKERKREFINDPPPPTDHTQDLREMKKAKIKQEQEQAEKEVLKWKKDHEICGICHAQPPKRMRAISCYHIFCKKCIERHFQKHCTPTTSCPVCGISVSNNVFVRYDKNHASFKSVEALERTTAKVVHVYPSASAASLQLESMHKSFPSRIVDACNSKCRDEREYQGYYWRFKGNKDRILRFGESIKEGVPIEQVDIETCEILNTFTSGRKASEKTGVSRCSIRRVLERRGKANAGGYFWRFQGETHKPWPDPEPTNVSAVEQLDFKTGDFLKAFDSLAEAKRAMNMRPNSSCIREVCDGKGRATAQGYFWRWKGSNRLPNHMMGVQKIIQIRKTPNGKIIQEFRTSREAQNFLGYQCCWSTICRFCREGGHNIGYYWTYRMLKKPQLAELEVVNKRLRIQQKSGSEEHWLEGKIAAFDFKSGKHEILYDSGIIEHYDLNKINYEWKNDQGQKPVEQLDLKTGTVIKTFDSISAASVSVVGPGERGQSLITAVCKGRCRSSFGFFWRYKGSKNMPTKPKGKKKIQQLSLETDQVIATFDTITAAAKAIGITSPGISYCCNGRNNSKSAGGYGWRFKPETSDGNDSAEETPALSEASVEKSKVFNTINMDSCPSLPSNDVVDDKNVEIESSIAKSSKKDEISQIDREKRFKKQNSAEVATKNLAACQTSENTVSMSLTDVVQHETHQLKPPVKDRKKKGFSRLGKNKNKSFDQKHDQNHYTRQEKIKDQANFTASEGLHSAESSKFSRKRARKQNDYHGLIQNPVEHAKSAKKGKFQARKSNSNGSHSQRNVRQLDIVAANKTKENEQQPCYNDSSKIGVEGLQCVDLAARRDNPATFDTKNISKSPGEYQLAKTLSNNCQVLHGQPNDNVRGGKVSNFVDLIADVDAEEARKKAKLNRFLKTYNSRSD